MLVRDFVAPAYHWVPPHRSSAGGEAIDLCAAAGLPLDAEQEMVVDSILAEKDGGKWAALEAVVVAPRQNIKTHVFKAVALADLYLFDAELVVWTAHEFSTAMEAFRDVQELVESSELLSRRVKRWNNQNGEEGLELVTGQRLRFKARTKTGGRGLTGTRTILDEAFALQPTHMGSLLPTMAAKSVNGNPQILYGSSAGQIGSAVLRSLRDRGRAGGDPSLVYLEWCDETECARTDCDHRRGTEGCALDDPEHWQNANLALGRRISFDFIEALRRSLPAEEFAREVLGWWDEPAEGVAGLPLDRWNTCATKTKLGDPIALAVDVSPGHASGAIVGAAGVVDVIAHGAGISWIPSRLAALVTDGNVAVVGIDPSSPAAALIPDLEKPVEEGGAGLSIRGPKNPNGLLVLMTARDMTGACELLFADVMEDRFRHRGQPELTEAVGSAYRRTSGDSLKWSRRDSTADISTLVAATEAWFLWRAGLEEEAEADFYLI